MRIAEKVRLVDRFAAENAELRTRLAAFEPTAFDAGRLALRSVGRVDWYHDTPGEHGGAEASNAELIRVGRLLGFDVRPVGDRWRPRAPHELDLLVLSGIRRYDSAASAAIDRLIFERRVPYVWLDRDYQFCIHRNGIPCAGDPARCTDRCASGWAGQRERIRRIANGARLRIFISERQRALYESIFGWVGPSILALPPVDTRLFRPMPDVRREEKLAVCACRRWAPEKGRDNVRAWATMHPDWRVEVYGAATRADGLPPISNLTIKGTKSPGEIPAVFARASLCLFLPALPEPAGRTPIEAALCGCPVETNENWSAACFGLSLRDPAALRDQVEDGKVAFWRAIDRVIHG